MGDLTTSEQSGLFLVISIVFSVFFIFVNLLDKEILLIAGVIAQSFGIAFIGGGLIFSFQSDGMKKGVALIIIGFALYMGSKYLI